MLFPSFHKGGPTQTLIKHARGSVPNLEGEGLVEKKIGLFNQNFDINEVKQLFILFIVVSIIFLFLNIFPIITIIIQSI